MDLFIETLTGTAFELRVNPFETIMNVKAKIQRLEGIPISQQHLIWRSVELEDDYCLHDYDINDGATLQLVLAMRGGPINMKRVPVEDNSLREMAEYVEANRDEIWDKLPKDNRQVTFLVFRDGEQYNVFRVVDRGDGTMTPLSDSLSGTSLYNLYDDEDEEASVTVPQETIQENNVTMNKMKLLKSKMQSLNMSKKSRGGGTSVEQVSFQPHSPPPASRIMYQPRPPSKEKHPKYQPRPPSGEKPTSALASRRRLHRTSSSLRDHQDIHENSSTTYIHQTANNTSIHLHESSSSLGKTLPPVNKNKKSNNIDISELVRNPPEDTPFRSKTLSKHFEHESGSKRGLNMNHKFNTGHTSNKSHGLSLSNGLSTSHGHKPLPNVGKQSNNSVESCDGGGKHDHSDNALEARLASYMGPQSKGYTTSGGKSIGPLKERKTSVERLRSGLLNDSLSRVHRTQQSSAGTLYSTTDVKRSRPPPPPQLVSGKKTRCTYCRKKTGLATTYACRCGNSFCATHRYAETHNCNYDYKTEGRKLLEQSNPLVVAPKLPKI
ncbi:AN1-type zinc finger protein 4-like [Dendronephthya gigantea]|uniref:AN1-type zinc finger protein 4-like n=1 Tax=Dendronephthya gigantea TaxID=151771 RepID=UPI00106BCF5A|nr:AN1-type zinc finger protein 4-like [Dendronephthya gigantea]